MKRIRGGRGLGDSIYVRPFVEHFISRGERVTVLSDYPDVFAGTEATVEPFNRQKFNVLAHYTKGKANRNTNQWQDVCASVGVSLPLAIRWKCRNPSLVQEVRRMAAGKPLVLVHGGRTHPWAGTSLLPQKRAFDAVLGQFSDCYTVKIGKGPSVYGLAVSLDLNDRTSVSDLLDLGQECDGIVGQCSYAVPLAEVFGKPLLAVWAAEGMAPGRHAFMRQITPKKVLSKATSAFVIDEWTDQQIREEVRAFRLVR